jgi:hypothetical protein
MFVLQLKISDFFAAGLQEYGYICTGVPSIIGYPITRRWLD